MKEELYDLVFKGEVVNGFDVAQVKKNLQGLFRISEAQVNSLFAGKAVPLKKGVNAEAANTYRVAMKKAGAKVNVVQSAVSAPPVPAPKPAAAPTPQPQKPTTLAAGTSSTRDSKEDQFQTALGAQPQKPAEPRQPINAPNFEVAATGANMINDNEKVTKPSVQVDISHLTVAENSGNLVSEDEIARLPTLEVDVPEFDVAPAGSDVLKPDERKQVKVQEVDTSNLTMANVGENLAPAKKAAPPAPNVDHIKLAD